MKKYLLIISAIILASLGWLFIERPHPPFLGSNPNQSQGPTYFAEIDKDGNVLRVIVISQENINTGKWGNPKNWVQTYYDGKRKNFADMGGKYSKINDYFIPLDPKVPGEIFDPITAKYIVPTP